MPFHEISREPNVIMKVSIGWKPQRPPHYGVYGSPWISWGLTEEIWELMEDCWEHNPSDRPAVKDIIARLSSVTDERLAKVDMAASSVRIENCVSREYSLSLDDVEPILSQFA